MDAANAIGGMIKICLGGSNTFIIGTINYVTFISELERNHLLQGEVNECTCKRIKKEMDVCHY